MSFVSENAHAVLQATQYSRLLPSVMMAQAILESGHGKSILAAQYNNYFGEKAGSNWKGKTVNLNTQEYGNGTYYTITDQFRVYSTKYAGFVGHVNFLKNLSRYDEVFRAKTAEGQARALQSAGYATAPNYADSLINIINKYNLKTLDKKNMEIKTINTIAAVVGLVYAILIFYKVIYVQKLK